MRAKKTRHGKRFDDRSQRRRLRRHAAQLGNTADTIELLSRPQSAPERGPI